MADVNSQQLADAAKNQRVYSRFSNGEAKLQSCAFTLPKAALAVDARLVLCKLQEGAVLHRIEVSSSVALTGCQFKIGSNTDDDAYGASKAVAAVNTTAVAWTKGAGVEMKKETTLYATLKGAALPTTGSVHFSVLYARD